MMPMHDQMCPHHPATSKTKGVSSMETALKSFWDKQREQLQNFTGFNRQAHLPLSRVRRILKSDPEVRMISWDAPALFSKACEFFILELTLRAWMHTQSCSRETIRRCDIFQAVKNSEIYDFLIDLVPFGPHCATHQGMPPPPEMLLPDMNIPINMSQIEEENLIAEPFINNKGFDLNADLEENLISQSECNIKHKGFDLNSDSQDCTCGFGYCNEHGSIGSCKEQEKLS